jgi:hypothetical protein
VSASSKVSPYLDSKILPHFATGSEACLTRIPSALYKKSSRRRQLGKQALFEILKWFFLKGFFSVFLILKASFHLETEPILACDYHLSPASNYWLTLPAIRSLELDKPLGASLQATASCPTVSLIPVAVLACGAPGDCEQ